MCNDQLFCPVHSLTGCPAAVWAVSVLCYIDIMLRTVAVGCMLCDIAHFYTFWLCSGCTLERVYKTVFNIHPAARCLLGLTRLCRLNLLERFV